MYIAGVMPASQAKSAGIWKNLYGQSKEKFWWLVDVSFMSRVVVVERVDCLSVIFKRKEFSQSEFGGHERLTLYKRSKSREK